MSDNIDFEFDVKDFVTEYRGGGDSPVQSVNGKIGNVVLTAQDVHALPDSTEIPSLDGYATQAWVSGQGYLTQHQDISGKANIEDIPTKVSDLQNDAGYLTQHQSLADYALKSELPTVPTNVSSFTNDAGYLTAHQDLSDYALKTDIPTVPTKVSDLTNDAGYLTSHQDISGKADKSEIPTKTSDLTNDSGFLTAHQDISGKADKTTVNALDTRVTTLEEMPASGLSTAVKNALLAIASHIGAWTDGNARQYYDALYDAFYTVTAISLSSDSLSLSSIGATSQLTATTTPAGGTVTWASSDTSVATVSNGIVTAVSVGSATITAFCGGVSAACAVTVSQATLTGISAVYTQSGTVLTSDSLDSLKADLVVTATWSDSTTSVIPSADYTLSGTLTAGTSTITVSYSGQTDTFTVNVTAVYAITNSLTNCANSNQATTITAGSSYSATITADSGYTLDSVTCTMGGQAQTVTGGVISIANVTGNIAITASATQDEPSEGYLYDYPFANSIASQGSADLGFATYTAGTAPSFGNDGTYDYLMVTGTDNVLVADTPANFALDGDFTISVYGLAGSARSNYMISWAEFVSSSMIPTKYNIVNGTTYTPSSGRQSQAITGLDIHTDGNGLGVSIANTALTYGASVYGAPAKAVCWDGAWHHYCLQRDNGVITMYFDKVAVWTLETNDTLYLADKLAVGACWSQAADDGTFKEINTRYSGIRNLIIDKTAIPLANL